MPTASRAIAALFLALTGVIGALLVVAHLPEGKPGDGLVPLAAGIGALVGWFQLGRQARGHLAALISHGLVAGVLLVLWGLFIVSGRDMLQRAMRRMYDGATEALIDVFRLMMDNAVHLLHADVLAALVSGAIISGLAAGAAARRWD